MTNEFTSEQVLAMADTLDEVRFDKIAAMLRSLLYARTAAAGVNVVATLHLHHEAVQSKDKWRVTGVQEAISDIDLPSGEYPLYLQADRPVDKNVGALLGTQGAIDVEIKPAQSLADVAVKFLSGLDPTCKGINCTFSDTNGNRHSSECRFEYARNLASGIASVTSGVTVPDHIENIKWRGEIINLVRLASVDVDASRYRKLIAATDMPFPLLSVCDDPENNPVHRYGRERIDSLIDGLDIETPAVPTTPKSVAPDISELASVPGSACPTCKQSLHVAIGDNEGKRQGDAIAATLGADGDNIDDVFRKARMLASVAKRDVGWLKDKYSKESYYSAISWVLGYLNGTGDNGSTMYKEILQANDEDELVAYVRKNGEMRFTGLDRFLRNRRDHAAMLASAPTPPTEGGENG